MNGLENKERLEASLLNFIERETKEPSSNAAIEAVPKMAQVLVELWQKVEC